ncbi:MAG: invasion associated locus B family protein [Pseudomonadota bacterium]|nr:invasion associated locus B family protein [Pseudomonadota bacterium]
MKKAFPVLLALLLCGIVPARADEVISTHGKWTLKCAAIKETKKENCIISQTVVAIPKDKGKPTPGVLGVAVGYQKDNPKPQIAFNIPPQVDVKTGLGFRVDEGENFSIAIDACSKVKCLARDWLAPDIEKLMSTGKTALITYVIPPQKERLGITLDLEGFTPAMKALRTRLGKG